MNLLHTPNLAWALLAEIAVIALIWATVASWRARRRHRQRYAALEALLNRMQQDQVARVTQKSEMLHTALGVPLAAARAAADQIVAEERRFMKSLLLPQLQGAPDLPEQVDQLLYRYADAQFDAWLSAMSSQAPPEQSATHLAGPDSDLLNPDSDDDDDDGERFSYKDDIFLIDEPHGVSDSGASATHEASTRQDLVPDFPLAESDLTDPEEDLDQESPEAGNTPLDVFKDALQATLEPDQEGAPQEPVIDKPPSRTQEEIDADIAASLRELEAAMGEIPHTTSLAADEEGGESESDLAGPAPLVATVNDELTPPDDSLTLFETDRREDALPGAAVDAPAATHDHEAMDHLIQARQAEPHTLERQAPVPMDQELDALLNEPWGQAEADSTPSLPEIDPDMETSEDTANGEDESWQPDPLAVTAPADEPVYLAESVDTLLSDLWGKDDGRIERHASIDDSEPTEDDSGTLTEITDARGADPDDLGKALEDDIPDSLATPGDAIAADEALSEGPQPSRGAPRAPAISPAEASAPSPAVEVGEIQPQHLVENDGEPAPVQPIPDPVESTLPEKKRTTRKSKPRSKKKKSPEPADAAGSKD